MPQPNPDRITRAIETALQKHIRDPEERAQIIASVADVIDIEFDASPSELAARHHRR